MAKECLQPHKVQQVEEEMRSSAGVSMAAGSTATSSQVKQVRLVTPPDAPCVEIFDLDDGQDYDGEARIMKVCLLEAGDLRYVEICIWFEPGLRLRSLFLLSCSAGP